MTASILREAENDLEKAFDYYERQRVGLGQEMLDEFRHGVDRILEHPNAWNPLDGTYRRYRLHRFSYGIVYRVDREADQIMIVAVMHLAQEPDKWRERDR